MNKIHLISIVTGVIIVIIIAAVFITKVEENNITKTQPITHLSKRTQKVDTVISTQSSTNLAFPGTNSTDAVAEGIKKEASVKRKYLSLIPEEPCPIDNFDVYVNEALQIFRKNLSDKEKDEALQKVDSIGMPMIMPVIMLALEDDSSEIRSTAIEAIKTLDNPCVIPAVEKAMNDSDPIIRMDAVETLLRVDDEGISDALIKAISDSDEDVREAAFEVMLFQESPNILPAAEAAAQIKNPDIQEQAISVLEDIPSVSAIDAIINYGLLSDYDEIRDTATKSLQSLTGENLNSYDKWIEWWDKNKSSCPENLSADEWATWWKNR